MRGFSCLASCYKYSPIIHGKYDYYFPVNKLRLHNTWNASHSMHTSSVPPHAHIQWSTWCGTSSGPPDAAHSVDHLGHISRCMRMWHPVVHWWATSGPPDVKVACAHFCVRELLLCDILFTRAGDGRWPRYQAKSLACLGCG